MQEFMYKQSMEVKAQELNDELNIYKEGLDNLHGKEELQKQIVLTRSEVLNLRRIVDKFNNLDSQMQAFAWVTNKNPNNMMAKEEFQELKRKYL